MTNSKFRPAAILVFAVVLLAQHAGTAQAQSVQLTAEQQRMLQQLPPAQREQALRQFRQFTQGNASERATQSQSAEQPIEPAPAAQPVDDSDDEPPEIKAGSTLILTVEAFPEDPESAEVIDPEESAARQELLERLRRQNPYRINDDGRIRLPGFDPINLAGLNEEQAGLRLSAVPQLRELSIGVTLLPLVASDFESVEPFGYDLFMPAKDSGTDRSQADVGFPVPVDYVVGPNDSVRIQLYGNKNAEYELFVERNGSISLPELGPVNVAGLTFSEMRELLATTVREQLIGTQVSVTMGELRMIQVFLVGEVNSPGSFNVGSLSTITTVLSAGGGVAPTGSLRDIQVKRNGKLMGRLDVYDLLLRGDSSGDMRLQSGDVVFVPPVGARVSVVGEVRRPGIYEYRGDANVADLVEIAGGITAAAFTSGVKIERVQREVGMVAVNVDFSADSGRSIAVKDGDRLIVPRALSAFEGSVVLLGNVHRPGGYEWRPGLRLTDVIPDTRAVKVGSDLNYVLIRREPQPNATPIAVSADLDAAWQNKGGAVDIELAPRDTVFVFDRSLDRSQFIEPFLEELELRSSREEPMPVATIGGSVNVPGRFPIEADMRIADLVRAGGGLAQSAYLDDAELTRYRINEDGGRETTIITIDLDRALDGDMDANIPVRPFDYLSIHETPKWRDQEFVEVLGEVSFPGRYPIRHGESLASVVERAGGVTDFASLQGSVFTREALKDREREQIEALATRIEKDLASMSLSDAGQQDAQSVGRTLLQRLRSTTPVGRLVIDLEGALNQNEGANLTLRGGDVLRIPQSAQEVTVIGEVQYATSHVHKAGLSRDDYIVRSGGTTAKADKKRIYVVRASGEVVANNQSRFFARNRSVEIQPGDTIVVPLDTDRMRPLTLWTNVTQILYNVAIAAAAASGF